MLFANKPLPRTTMGLFFAASLGLGMAGCNTAPGTRDIAFGAASSALSQQGAAGALVLTADDGASYDVTRISAHVRDIELYLPDGAKCSDYAAQLAGGATCDDSGADDSPDSADDSAAEDKITIPGPFVLDLLNRTATPDLSSVAVPDLPYRRIDVRIDDAEDSTLVPQTDPLFGQSWVVEATSQDGASKVRVALRFNEDIRIESPNGVSFGDGSTLLVQFDVAGWLTGVPLSACLQSGEAKVSGDTLIIDDSAGGSSCSGVDDAFKSNVKDSSDLSDDDGADDDGADDIGDDNGGGAEPGDDNGGGAEPGDDNGGGAEPGDDKGGGGAEPGDDNGGGV